MSNKAKTGVFKFVAILAILILGLQTNLANAGGPNPEPPIFAAEFRFRGTQESWPQIFTQYRYRSNPNNRIQFDVLYQDKTTRTYATADRSWTQAIFDVKYSHLSAPTGFRIFGLEPANFLVEAKYEQHNCFSPPTVRYQRPKSGAVTVTITNDGDNTVYMSYDGGKTWATLAIGQIERRTAKEGVVVINSLPPKVGIAQCLRVAWGTPSG